MSIRRKLFLGIIAFILGFILLALGLFVIYMPSFVEKTKQSEMLDIAQMIQEIEGEESLELLITDISGATDITVVLENEAIQPSGGNGGRGRGMGRNFVDGFGGIIAEASTMNSSAFYTVKHHALNTDFMIYKDTLSNGNAFFIMRPVESIDDVVKVAKDFFMGIAVLALMSGLIFSYFYSSMFVGPILKLNEIARHMANMDFSHSYSETGRDEIGELGRSINHLSTNLDKALRELEAELRYKEKLNRLQKRFLADASHELKTPLAVIMGNVEQLGDISETDGQKSRYFNTIISELEHMNQVIHDLLRLSELEGDDDLLTLRHEDLASVIDDVLYAYSGMIKDKAIDLQYNLPESIPLIIDVKHMETVMRNVIGNALKHCDVGAQIALSADYHDDVLKLSVFNTSNPIPESELESLFDRFSKYDTQLKNGNKSTGLGLAIVKRILDLHGFEYGMYNKEKGIVFEMTIPVK